MSQDNPTYDQVKAEFDAIFELNDSSFDESNYKQFVTMAMTLNDTESIRNACNRYCSLYGYEDSLVLSWLYRELKNYSATKDAAILDYMYTNIFQKSLTEKYCKQETTQILTITSFSNSIHFILQLE